jgi:hypothetical protein
MAEENNREIIETWNLADMEKDFLSACLLDTQQSRKMWVNLYTHIDKTYFNEKKLGDVFLFFKLFFDKYKAMPTENRTISVMKENLHFADEDLNMVRSIYQKDVFKTAEIEALEDDVQVFVKNNKIKNAVMKSIVLLKESKYNAIETAIRDAIAWNADVDLGLDISVDTVRERYSRVKEHYSSFVLSPWKRLNEVLGGGFFRKQLSMVASSSSVGKSIFLDNVAAHAWLHQDKDVIMYSMEMSDLVKSLRIDAALTQMEIKDLHHNEDRVFEYYETTIGNRNNKLIIKEYPTSSASPQDLMQNLYQLELYKGIKNVGLICTDYSDIMRPTKDYKGNKYMEDKDINEGLRAMAQTLDLPVVTATQFGRSATNCPLDELTEEKLSDSFWKMRSADVLVALWNTPELREAGEIWMKTLKNRGGRKDYSWQMCVDYQTLRIFE